MSAAGKCAAPSIMAQPSYSYGTAATVFGKNPTDSYYALKDASGGGSVIPGNLEVGGNLDVIGTINSGGNLVVDGTITTSGGGNLDVTGTINGASNLSLGPYIFPVIELFSTAPGPSTQFGQTTSYGFIQAKDGGGTSRGPQIQYDALNDRCRLTSTDTTAPLLDVAASLGAGVVNSFCTTTVARPTGDVAVDALLKVQNGGGYGIAIRSNAGDVTAGGTIERVSAGVASDVPDITITSTGAVNFAQSTTVAMGARANAPLFNLVGGNGVSNYGIINCPGGGVPTPVTNANITGTSIVHLTPISATPLTAPVSYVQNVGVGFTIYHNNVGSIDVAYSVHCLSAGS